MSNIAQVDNDSLDTVTLAFDLGLEALHLVAVEGILDILLSHCQTRSTLTLHSLDQLTLGMLMLAILTVFGVSG